MSDIYANAIDSLRIGIKYFLKEAGYSGVLVPQQLLHIEEARPTPHCHSCKSVA